MNPRRLFWLLILAGFLLLFAWLGLKGWRIYQAVQSLLAAQGEAELVLAGDPREADPEALEALLHGVRQDVVVLRDEAAVFMPLTPYLGWVPQLGSTLLIAPQLMTMADSGTETAVIAFRGLKPALVALQNPIAPGVSRMSQLVNIIAEAEADLNQASISFDRFMAARSEIEVTDDLPWRLQTALTQLDGVLPLGQAALKAAPLLPELLGVNEPRRYLILAQNEDELRATGGFITGAGVLSVANGSIVELAFEDANWVDNWQEKPYAFPPQPLYDFMRLELFLFRDANFWPDFPASARKALELYAYGQDVEPLDGVIAIDQRFTQLLVEVTGPVPIDDTGQVIDSQNVIDTMRGARELQEGQNQSEWLYSRKDFLGIFGNAIRSRIENDFSSLDPIFLARNMLTAIEGKHLQIYMENAGFAQTLHELGWSGRLPQPEGHDYLFVVDTNMGYSKANVFVKRQIQYDVALQDNGQAISNVTLHYNHTAPATSEPCFQDATAEYSERTAYINLAEKCYWNYLRIYTPAGSQLISGSKHFVPGETMFRGVDWEGETATIEEFAGLTTFTNFFMLTRANTLTTNYQYTTPTVVAPTMASTVGQTAVHRTYRLDVTKQASTQNEPLLINVTLPPGATFISATPEPTEIVRGSGNIPTTIHFASTLTADQTYLISFE
ncbi:MAG: DUF4012 domain-containing protein [Chloroflexota bacterium]